MSNSFFRFKQFTIHQEHCAMKVCTDSCILASWTASQLHSEKKILDIGTGTGLLSLMIAQKSPAFIDSIEVDIDAVNQARENIEASPWNHRIQVFAGDARIHTYPTQYDFIITNPPFFESDLRSPAEKKNNAKHADMLSLDHLPGIIRNNLKPDGLFSILLPFHRSDYFEKLAAGHTFFIQKKLIVSQTPHHKPFRSICLYGSVPAPQTTEYLIVKDHGKYTPDFTALMESYYPC